jgi:hypothetical protein
MRAQSRIELIPAHSVRALANRSTAAIHLLELVAAHWYKCTSSITSHTRQKTTSEESSWMTMKIRSCYSSALLLFLVLANVSGEEAKGSEDANAIPSKAPSKPKFDATDHTDWGTYYDPKGEFCGKYDCYKILGFDFEEFGKQHPDRKEITQRYRSLSRAWHPDKSKHRDAKDRFVVRSHSSWQKFTRFFIPCLFCRSKTILSPQRKLLVPMKCSQMTKQERNMTLCGTTKKPISRSTVQMCCGRMRQRQTH